MVSVKVSSHHVNSNCTTLANEPTPVTTTDGFAINMPANCGAKFKINFTPTTYAYKYDYGFFYCVSSGVKDQSCGQYNNFPTTPKSTVSDVEIANPQYTFFLASTSCGETWKNENINKILANQAFYITDCAVTVLWSRYESTSE